MLERYFVKPETVDRIRNAWLGDPIERYVNWLTQLDYSPRNVHRRVPLLMHFAEFSAKRGARRWEELPSHVEAFVTEWCHSHGKHRKSKRAKQELASEAGNPIWQMLELIYAEITTAMKAAALNACEPPPQVGAASPKRAVWRDDPSLLKWLNSL